MRFGSFVAGGSDSYCYVHQAERWASGRLLVPEPLALTAPWPNAALTFTPAGHVPSASVPGAIVPICPPGLSMLMAPALALGGRTAMFAVIPLCGVLLVVATWLLGRRVGDGVALAAALVTAASPVVLYQVIQPMSDVPAAAFWLLALALATRRDTPASLAAGVCGGVAILIRPNLVPLGFVIGAYLLVRPDAAWGARLRQSLRYAIGCAAGCLAVAAVQQHFYGSPLASGYGAASDLFSIGRVAPNAWRYASWLVQAHGPLLVLAAVAPFVLARPFAAVGVGFCLVNVALYLPYLTFDDWSYVRFLLPSIPVLAVFGMGTVSLAARAGGRVVSVALSLAALVLTLLGVREAGRRQAFRLAELESVFPRTGRVVAARLPGERPRRHQPLQRQRPLLRVEARRSSGTCSIRPRSIAPSPSRARNGLEPYPAARQRRGAGVQDAVCRQPAGAAGLAAADRNRAAGPHVSTGRSRALPGAARRVDTEYVR